MDNELAKQNFIVNGNIVMVDEYQFQINKEKLIIEFSLGKGQEDSEMQLRVSSTINSGYSKATIKIEIKTLDAVKAVKLDGKNLEIPEPTKDENNKNNYTIEEEVIENKKYNVYVQTNKESYKLGSTEVKQISEDLDIHNSEELKAFRDKVNQGVTYEGKTVNLLQDIELNENKYTIASNGTITFSNTAEQWTPIGDQNISEECCFKRTFNGNDNTISGIYINTTNGEQGLFSYNQGNIKNLKITNSYAKGEGNVGLLTAYSEGNLDKITVSNSYIYGKTRAGAIAGTIED